MILILFGVLILNFFLESTVMPYLTVFDVQANLGMVIVIAISLLRGRKYGSIMGLLIGLLQDIVFGHVIGINSLIYFFIGYGLGYLESNIARDNYIIPMFLAFIMTYVYNFFYGFFIFFLGHDVEILDIMVRVGVVESIYNGLLMYIAYKIFLKIFTAPAIRFTRG